MPESVTSHASVHHSTRRIRLNKCDVLFLSKKNSFCPAWRRRDDEDSGSFAAAGPINLQPTMNSTLHRNILEIDVKPEPCSFGLHSKMRSYRMLGMVNTYKHHKFKEERNNAEKLYRIQRLSD